MSAGAPIASIFGKNGTNVSRPNAGSNKEKTYNCPTCGPMTYLLRKRRGLDEVLVCPRCERTLDEADNVLRSRWERI